MGAAADLNAAGARWLSPLALWTGILAGPLAWALDLLVSYALVKWSCAIGSAALLHLVTVVALTLVLPGAIMSWLALRATSAGDPTDGGLPRQRARFMALLGLTTSALFALAIVAGALPRWVLDACL